MEEVRENPVQVVIRCRPFSEKELRDYGDETGVLLKEENATITAIDPKNKTMGRSYAYDEVYGPESTQEAVYKGCCQEVTLSVIDGFNGSIIAYGQTGTGKTYTMEGDPRSKDHQGVMCHALRDIFYKIDNDSSRTFQVKMSYIEIYQDTLRDLLNVSGKKLTIHEIDGGVYVGGLTNVVCRKPLDVITLYVRGKSNRKTQRTNMSIASSRSHAILRLTITSFDDRKTVKSGVLNLVDLAGSESQRKSGTKGKALKEASKMNASLSTLGKVVSLLSSGNHKHIPYRDCKLTRILQESLGGNCYTTIIATIGPSFSNMAETLSTLRFSSSARNMKNIVTLKLDPTCGEGGLIKEKITEELSGVKFKVVQVEELRKKLRLINIGLAEHPNDPKLQQMACYCKSMLEQILRIQDGENDAAENKEELKVTRDTDMELDLSEGKFQKSQLARCLLESIESFQQEVTSVMTSLEAQIEEFKMMKDREDEQFENSNSWENGVIHNFKTQLKESRIRINQIRKEIGHGDCVLFKKKLPDIPEEFEIQENAELNDNPSFEKLMVPKCTQVSENYLHEEDISYTIISHLFAKQTILNSHSSIYIFLLFLLILLVSLY